MEYKILLLHITINRADVAQFDKKLVSGRKSTRLVKRFGTATDLSNQSDCHPTPHQQKERNRWTNSSV